MRDSTSVRVIPEGRQATDRESSMTPGSAWPFWIPGQTFGLPGMTKRDQAETI
jgi:hypothetical protein